MLSLVNRVNSIMQNQATAVTPAESEEEYVLFDNDSKEEEWKKLSKNINACYIVELYNGKWELVEKF